MLITVVKRMPASEIRKETPKVIKKIAKWFEQNPKRRVCHAVLWQEERATIRRAHIEDDVRDAANRVIADNAISGFKR